MKRKIGMPKTLLLAMIASMAVVPIIMSTPAMAQVSLRLQGNPAAPQVNTTADHDHGTCEVLNTSTSPHKDCTLREAIAFANPGARVRFNQTVFATTQTIALSEGGLHISKNLTIAGPTAGVVFRGNLSFGPVFSIGGGTTVAISRVTITEVSGGGIDNDGTLTLTNCTIFQNVAVRGGGIRNSGTLTLIKSTVDANGAGVTGGGIYNDGTLTLTNSTISRNSATQSGGGIYNAAERDLTLTNSTVSGNMVVSDGDLLQGGGIYNDGTLTLTNSTVSGNRAELVSVPGGGLANAHGGGIYNAVFSDVTLTNSTISGNRAIRASDNLLGQAVAGGIYNDGLSVTLTASTVADNVAADVGGIFNNPNPRGPPELPPPDGGHLTLTSSIVARNTAVNRYPDISDPFPTTASFSLIGSSEGHLLSDGLDGNIVGVSARLGPLQDNGGPTLTHAPRPGSPAIDAGLTRYGADGSRTCDAATDQRARARPRDGGCDMGAVEFRSTRFPAFAFVDPVQNPPTINVVPAGGVVQVTVQVTFSLGGDKGLSILAAGSPTSQPFDCETLATPFPPEVAAGALNYEAAADRYSYGWQTERASRDSCHQFRLRLSDGTTYRADFRLLGCPTCPIPPPPPPP